MRLLVALALVRRLLGAARPGGRGLERRSLRDPGRRLARARPGHARRAARPARAARRRPRPLQPALGPDRAGRGEPDWEESDLVLEGLRAAASRPSSASSARRAGRTAAGRRTSRRGAPTFAAFARAARDALPLGEQVARSGTSRTRRAGSGRPRPPSTSASSSTPPTRRSTPSNPRARGRRRRHRARAARPAVSRRSPGSAACARPRARLDAYAHHPYPSSTPRDAVRRRLHATARRSRWRRSSGCSPRSARLRPEADLADRVRLPDRRLRRQPAAAGRADRPVRAARLTRRRGSTC